MKKKRTSNRYCKVCNDILPEGNRMKGFCNVTCAKKESLRLMRYFRNSFIIGSVLSFLIIGFIRVAKANYVPPEVEYVVFSATYAVSIPGLMNAICSITNETQFLLFLACIIGSFGRYIQIDRENNQIGMGSLGLMIFELFVSVIIAPLFLLYNVFYLMRLTLLVKSEEH